MVAATIAGGRRPGLNIKISLISGSVFARLLNVFCLVTGVIKCIMALTFEWNSRSGIESMASPAQRLCVHRDRCSNATGRGSPAVRMNGAKSCCRSWLHFPDLNKKIHGVFVDNSRNCNSASSNGISSVIMADCASRDCLSHHLMTSRSMTPPAVSRSMVLAKFRSHISGLWIEKYCAY